MKMMANCFSFRINFVGGVFGEWSFIAGVFVGSESFSRGNTWYVILDFLFYFIHFIQSSE
jgi:hypothetical protein